TCPSTSMIAPALASGLATAVFVQAVVTRTNPNRFMTWLFPRPRSRARSPLPIPKETGQPRLQVRGWWLGSVSFAGSAVRAIFNPRQAEPSTTRNTYGYKQPGPPGIQRADPRNGSATHPPVY